MGGNRSQAIQESKTLTRGNPILAEEAVGKERKKMEDEVNASGQDRMREIKGFGPDEHTDNKKRDVIYGCGREGFFSFFS